jgi:hypothetical protein
MKAMDRRFCKVMKTQQHDYSSPYPEGAKAGARVAAGAFAGDGRASVSPTSKAPQQPGRGR